MSRVTTFREFWARSDHFGPNGCWDKSHGAQVFLCGNPRTFRQLCNGRRIFTKFDHEMYFGVPSRNPEIHLENFHFRGHLPPKSEIESRSNRHLTQSTQQVRDALQRDTVYFMMYSEVQGVSEVGQRFCTTYGCGATGRQSCQIFGFWPTVFSSYKTPKTYLPVTSLQLVGYNAEWLRFFHVVFEGPKGCLRAAQFSCDFWYKSWGPPNLPKVSPMANGSTDTEFYNTARQIWTKDVWKFALLRTDVLFHQISSPLSQNHPKTPFLGTF